MLFSYLCICVFLPFIFLSLCFSLFLSPDFFFDSCATPNHFEWRCVSSHAEFLLFLALPMRFSYSDWEFWFDNLRNICARTRTLAALSLMCVRLHLGGILISVRFYHFLSFFPFPQTQSLMREYRLYDNNDHEKCIPCRLICFRARKWLCIKTCWFCKCLRFNTVTREKYFGEKRDKRQDGRTFCI